MLNLGGFREVDDDGRGGRDDGMATKNSLRPWIRLFFLLFHGYIIEHQRPLKSRRSR